MSVMVFVFIQCRSCASGQVPKSILHEVSILVFTTVAIFSINCGDLDNIQC